MTGKINYYDGFFEGKGIPERIPHMRSDADGDFLAGVLLIETPEVPEYSLIVQTSPGFA